jgi:hypothetical protein
MSLPVIPLLAAAVTAEALWFYQLDEDCRRRADRQAIRLSYRTYNKTPDRLTAPEARLILARVREHLFTA